MASWFIVIRIFVVLLAYYTVAIFASPEVNIDSMGTFPIYEKDGRIKREAGKKSRSLERNSDHEGVHKRIGRQFFCLQSVPCNSSLYRTIDGTCNNLNNPLRGSSGIPYVRMIPSQYEDGFFTPRGAGRPYPLPGPRRISVEMTNTFVPSVPDAITEMVMQFGQFINHDMVLTLNDGTGIYFDVSCCGNFMDPTPTSPSCMPIDVTGDPFYSTFNVTCLPFVRSADSFCWQEREQLNRHTAYLDGSGIYGFNSDLLAEVREPNSWKLKAGPGNESCPTTCPFTFLPVRNNIQTFIEEFFAGDPRVEQTPALTSMHTIFVRMHNSFGQIIRNKNSTFTDDKVFEETRKIIGAVIQQITYNEFLPLVIGNAIMNASNLVLRPVNSTDPFFNGYNPNVDGSILNEFAAAAFRFGHSLITGTFSLPGGGIVNLAESFNNHTSTTIPGSFPSHFLRGLCADLSEEMDHILVDAVQNKLLATAPFQFGSDLYSVNIERGRDHGLAPYITWLNTCRCLPRAISRFNDLYQVMPNATVDTLYNLYGGRLQDIDLFPAAIAERNLPGSLIGPTFTCILTEQFVRLKFGDRYWFENPNVFTKAQLRSLRNTKLSSLLCNFTDAIELQENVMQPVSSSNPLRSCADLIKKGITNDVPINW